MAERPDSRANSDALVLQNLQLPIPLNGLHEGLHVRPRSPPSLRLRQAPTDPPMGPTGKATSRRPEPAWMAGRFRYEGRPPAEEHPTTAASRWRGHPPAATAGDPLAPGAAN